MTDWRPISDREVRFWAITIVGGVALFVAVFAAVILTRQTFGQRCEDAGNDWGSPAWHECVHRLAADA